MPRLTENLSFVYLSTIDSIIGIPVNLIMMYLSVFKYCIHTALIHFSYLEAQTSSEPIRESYLSLHSVI